MENITTTNGKRILTPTEKGVAGVIGLGIFAFLVWFGVKIMPWVLAATFNFIIFGTIVGAGILIWLNRKMITLRYQLWVKKMWRAIVKSDPISVMEIQWKKWTKKRKELNDSIETMKAGESELIAAMDENQSMAKNKFAMAKKAEELGDKKKDPEYDRRAKKNSIVANRLMQSNQSLLPRLQAIQKAIDYCTKLHERWGDDLELLKQDIDLRKRDLKLLSITSNAFDSARSILNDDPDERALWEMATEATAEKVSNYVANITRFTEKAKDWVADKDIEAAVWEDEGQKLLSMYDQDTFNQLTDFRSLLDKNEDKTFIQSNKEYQQVLAQPMGNKTTTNTFKDLL